MKVKINSIIEYTGYGLIAAYFLFGCNKNETVKTAPLKPEVIVADRNNASIIHLYSDTVYIINTPVVREAGQELVVDAGTLIKMPAGITIKPGAKIYLNGTRDKPVVFTTNVYTGADVGNGDGINITGKAKNNERGGSGDDGDFSGNITFTRLEFAPLTLDAVGNKTIIENVMISYAGKKTGQSAKSSFIILGGNFNAKNLVSYACDGPADFYITNGYRGNLLNLLAYRNFLFGSTGNGPFNALSGVYISNQLQDAAALPNTFPVISNLTVLGPNNFNGTAPDYTGENSPVLSAALVADKNAFFSVRNSLLLGFPRGGIIINDSLTLKNLAASDAKIAYTYFHANDSARTFYLPDAVYPPYNSYALAALLLEPSLKNVKFYTPVNYTGDFGFADPFNYNNPNLVPKDGSPVFAGADFTDDLYKNPFFTSVPILQIGAIGKDNWLIGWTNFAPLKTNYNNPDFKPF